jgi:hypothetical protein
MVCRANSIATASPTKAFATSRNSRHPRRYGGSLHSRLNCARWGPCAGPRPGIEKYNSTVTLVPLGRPSILMLRLNAA